MNTWESQQDQRQDFKVRKLERNLTSSRLECGSVLLWTTEYLYPPFFEAKRSPQTRQARNHSPLAKVKDKSRAKLEKTPEKAEELVACVGGKISKKLKKWAIQ